MLIAVTMTIAVPPPTTTAATENSQATTTIAVSALAGVRKRCETFFSQREPGIPSSRLNANSIRPAAATDDSPQKAIAMAMPAASRSPTPKPRMTMLSRLYWRIVDHGVRRRRSSTGSRSPGAARRASREERLAGRAGGWSARAGR